MDPLSDVLALLNPRGALPARLIAGGNWAMRFPAFDGVKFATIINGSCWLDVEGQARPLALKAGDSYLLTKGQSYRLCSDLKLPDVNAREVFADGVNGVARHGETVDLDAIGGRFTFDKIHASLLLDVLPAVIHVDSTLPEAAVVRWALSHLVNEVSNPGPGAKLMIDHLAHVMFVQALRTYLQSTDDATTGWLGALSDSMMAVALGLMHREPARRWTVNELAVATGMSRSTFAQRFKALVGVAPLTYLLGWRMRLAVHELLSGSKTVASIALLLGYESESAFSNTFRRVIGCAPTHYRVRHRPAPESVEA